MKTKPLLYIDLFCGAGGTTTGVLASECAQVVAAVNHDETAIASHAANHPGILHFTEDIRTLDVHPMVERLQAFSELNPAAKTVLWASCECTNFSKAKGGKTRDPDSRSLADHLFRYVEALDPDFVQIENVEEFLFWGPLVEVNGSLVPDKDRRGEYFRRWFVEMEGHGYRGDWRVLNAADFGAYTSRKRLFIQFARTGHRIAWPKPTHSRKNWKACRDILDLDDMGESIFTRKKPLVDATLRRITEGVRKFCTADAGSRATFMQRYFSGRGHNTSVDTPCGTLTTIPHQYVTTATFMDNYFGRGYATSIGEPCGTLCTKQQRFPVTAVFLANYYSGGGQLAGTEGPCPTLTTVPKPNVVTASFIHATLRPMVKNRVYSVDDPMNTLMTKNYFSIDTCRYSGLPDYSRPADGDSEAMLALKAAMRERGIADICMRPISVRESLRVMGFPEDYKLKGTQTQQRKFIGNAVEVNIAEHMVRALAASLRGVYQPQPTLF